jgi:hypothetical protein
MASIREHVQNVHAAEAAHNNAVAAEIQDTHPKIAKLCKAHAELHSQFADDCEKSESDRLDKIVPDRIGSIARTDAPPQAFGISAHPRVGSPSAQTFDKAAVPPEFQHLLSTMTDGE